MAAVISFVKLLMKFANNFWLESIRFAHIKSAMKQKKIEKKNICRQLIWRPERIRLAGSLSDFGGNPYCRN